MAASITYNGKTYDLATTSGMDAYKTAVGITSSTPTTVAGVTAPLGTTERTQQLLTAGNTLGTASSQVTGIPYTPVTYTPPVATSVPPPVKNIELPPTTATDTNDAYITSLITEAANARKALEDTYKKQIEDLNTKQTAAQTKIDEFTAKQESIVGPGGSVDQLTQPFRQQLETSERERLKVEENYFANQKLTNELDSLLTEGNTLIQQVKGVTGLAGIRNPRINQAIDAVNSRVGVISAVMAARSGQIAEAYRLIDRSLGAITADRQDRLGYYQTLMNFYENQKDTEGEKLISLEEDEKGFVKAQISLLENDLNQAQENVNYIKELMINPESADFMASAGVTLSDTPLMINAKLAAESRKREAEDFKNERIAEGYEYVPFPQGQDVVQFSVGGQTLSFKRPPATSEGGFTLGDTRYDAQGNVLATNPDGTEGTLEERQASALSNYANAFVKGATYDGTTVIGTDGYIDPRVWKDAIADAVNSGINRKAFIEQFGYLINTSDKKNKSGVIPVNEYGLTASELKIIKGEL